MALHAAVSYENYFGEPLADHTFVVQPVPSCWICADVG